MADSIFPILEASLVASESVERHPGDFYIDNSGKAYTVLEDGTKQLIRDKTFTDMIYTLINNKPLSQSEVNVLDKNNISEIFLDGAVNNTSTMTSVHNVVLDEESNILKRMSTYTDGQDVIFGKTTITDILNSIFSIPLDLDEYFDTESNTHLLKTQDGKVKHDLKLKLRKLQNIDSDNDEDYVNMLIDAEVANLLLDQLNERVYNAIRFDSTQVQRTYTDSNGDVHDEVLDMTSSEVDTVFSIAISESNDLKVYLKDSEIYIEHVSSDSGMISVSAESGTLQVIKSITVSNTGHVTAVMLRNMTDDGDIYKLFYTTDLANAMFIRKDVHSSVVGSIDVKGSVTTGSLADVRVLGSMSVSGDVLNIHTENTAYKDNMVHIDVDYNKYDEQGVRLNVYNEVENWSSDIFADASIESSGCDLGLSGNNIFVTLDKDNTAAYAPSYYQIDKNLNGNYYVADINIVLSETGRNKLLSHASTDIVNMHSVLDSQLLLNFICSSLLHANKNDITVEYCIQYKTKFSDIFVSYGAYETIPTDGIYTKSIVGIVNHVDLQSIRFNIRIKILKSVIVTDLDTVTFMLVYNCHITDKASNVLSSTSAKQYTPLYITGSITYPPQSIYFEHHDSVDKTTVNAYDTFYEDFDIIFGPGYSKVGKLHTSEDILYSYTNINFGISKLKEYRTRCKKIAVSGYMAVDYILGESEANISDRINSETAPDVDEYVVYVDLYILPYSATISAVGYTDTYVNAMNETISDITPTTYIGYSRTNKALYSKKNIKISIQKDNTLGILTQDILIDVYEIAKLLENQIETFKGEFVKEMLYVDMDLRICKKINNNNKNQYDKVTLTGFRIDVDDIYVEYRSTKNNVSVDPTLYIDTYMRFKNSEFLTLKNTVNTSTFSVSPGITSLKYIQAEDLIRLILNKDYAVTYTQMGIRSEHESYEQSAYFFKQIIQRDKKENLIKCVFKCKKLENFPLNDMVTIRISLLAETPDTSVRVPVFYSLDLSDDTAFISKNNISILNISQSPYTLADAQDFAIDIMQDNRYNDIYDFNMKCDGLQYVAYFDANAVDPDAILTLEFMIDVAYARNTNTYKELTLDFDAYRATVLYDSEYRDTNPYVGYFKKFDIVHTTDYDGMIFKENTSAYTSVENLLKLKSNKFLGSTTYTYGFANPLKISFSKDIEGVKGDVTISGSLSENTVINTTHARSSVSIFGYVGLLNALVPVEHDRLLPTDATYNACAIRDSVKKLFAITTASSAVIDYFKVVNGSLEYTAAPAAYKDTVATTSVVYDYYKNIQALIKKVNAHAEEQTQLAWDASFREIDVSLFHKEWFMFDQEVNVHYTHEEWKTGKVMKTEHTRDRYIVFKFTTMINGIIGSRTEPGLGNADSALSVANINGSISNATAFALNGIANFSATIGESNGTSEWLERSEEVTFFMSNYDKSKLTAGEVDITTHPSIMYAGYVTKGVTTATIVIKFKDLLALAGRNRDWWNADYSGYHNIKNKAYAVRYRAYQKNVLIWDSGMIQHDYFETLNSSVISIPVTGKIYGRTPFKITKQVYTKRNTLTVNRVGGASSIYGAWGKSHSDMLVTESKESFWDKVSNAVGGLIGAIAGAGITAGFAAVGFAVGGPAGAWYAGSAIAAIYLGMQNGSSSGFEIPSGVYGKNASLFYDRPARPVPLYEYAIVKYNEYFTFPWLTPEAHTMVKVLSLQHITVYQSLLFYGYYSIKSNIDGVYTTEPLVVTHPNYDYSYCFMTDINHLNLKNIPEDAICSVVGYSSAQITESNIESHKVILYYIDLAKIGISALSKQMIEFYEPLYRMDTTVKPNVRMYPMSAQVDAISSTYMLSAIPNYVEPNIQIDFEISDHAPSTTLKSGSVLDNTPDGSNIILFTKSTYVGSNGSIYADSTTPLDLTYEKYISSKNSTYIIDRYKCVAKLRTRDNTCLLRDTRATNLKTVSTTPVIIPTLTLNASFTQKLTEEVPE